MIGNTIGTVILMSLFAGLMKYAEWKDKTS